MALNITPLPTLLDEELCYIFPKIDNPDLQQQPLPAVISNADCSGRQLAVWQLMGHTSTAIYNKVDPQQRHSTVMSWRPRMAMRLMRWRKINGIVPYAADKAGSKHFEESLNAAADLLSDDQLFFRRLTSSLNFAALTFTPAIDRDVHHRATAMIRNIALPMPQDVPAWLRTAFTSRGRQLPTFSTWLVGHPTVVQAWFTSQSGTTQNQLITPAPPATMIGPVTPVSVVPTSTRQGETTGEKFTGSQDAIDAVEDAEDGNDGQLGENTLSTATPATEDSSVTLEEVERQAATYQVAYDSDQDADGSDDDAYGDSPFFRVI